MKTPIQKASWGALLLPAIALCALLPRAQAGDVYLTGHDVLLHGGQNGYDGVILDYLRGGAAKATYNIGVVGTNNVGYAAFTGTATNIASGATYHAISTASGTLTGYGTATFYNAATLAADANRATILAGLDLLIVESYQGCGGCSLTAAGSAALNTMAGDIATAFNAGMDIWGQAGDGLSTYYNFLPASAVASGASIGGSSGFVATPAGVGIGIASNMINGFPTHNRFTSQAAAFTTYETRPLTGSTEIISIGLKGGTIDTGGGISVPDSGSTALLLGLALSGCVGLRRVFRVKPAAA